MILCLCEAVTDRQIRQAVHQGADTVREIARTTRAGTCCGACACDVRKLLREARAAAAEEALPLAAK
ncbi:MAG: (2Fe-2S)-binding protein [Thermoanaerobaculia bacterium]